MAAQSADKVHGSAQMKATWRWTHDEDLLWSAKTK
jgi:hypothetical protein